MDCPLFKDCTPAELELFFREAPCRRKSFDKGALLLHQGEEVSWAGILLSGRIKACLLTENGSQHVQALLSPGDMFGYVLMSTEESRSPVTLEALGAGEALYVPFAAIMGRRDVLGDKLRVNLLHALSRRCWSLTRRVRYLSQRSLRGRISLYLLDQRERTGSLSFCLPLTREELAALLAVNRSALSRELGRMEQEGLLARYKNAFKLLDIPALERAAQ